MFIRKISVQLDTNSMNLGIQTFNANNLLHAYKCNGNFEDNVPKLNVDDVHIWTVSLNPSDDIISEFSNILSADEKEKADRFKFPELKKQYTVFHAVLRKLLSHYLGSSEKEITYTHGAYGKPEVTENINLQNIRFNMSKSSEAGIYAFTLQNEVGVDIEKIKSMPDMNSIVKRHFSKEETELYEGLQDSEKEEWFYTIWARKEALLKAIGCGLYMPLEQIDVSRIDKIRIDTDLKDMGISASNIIMDDLELAAGYKSAICTFNNLN